jgi:hypothetical protein
MWNRILLCGCTVVAAACESAVADDPQISISTRLHTVYFGSPGVRVASPIATVFVGEGVRVASPVATVFVGQGATVWSRQISCELICYGDIANDFGTLGASDGQVSFGDFLAMLSLVGPCPGNTPGCVGDIGDDFGTLNGGDGSVSFGDFLALLGLIGNCLPQ